MPSSHLTVWPQCLPGGAVLPSGHCVPKVEGGQAPLLGAVLPSGHWIGKADGHVRPAGTVLPSGHWTGPTVADGQVWPAGTVLPSGHCVAEAVGAEPVVDEPRVDGFATVDEVVVGAVVDGGRGLTLVVVSVVAGSVPQPAPANSATINATARITDRWKCHVTGPRWPSFEPLVRFASGMSHPRPIVTSGDHAECRKRPGKSGYSPADANSHERRRFGATLRLLVEN